MSAFKKPTIVYICYPTTTGSIEENALNILHLCLDIQMHCPNTIPFAPYLTYFRYLDISNAIQSQMLIDNTREFFERKTFDEMWVAGTQITEEMMLQIEWAIDYDIPIVPYSPYLAKDLEIVIEEYENITKVLH